jgi:hypothetical protein
MMVYEFNYSAFDLRKLIISFQFKPDKIDMKSKISKITNFIVSMFDLSDYHKDYSRIFYVISELLDNTIKFSCKNTLINFDIYDYKKDYLMIEFINFINLEKLESFKNYIEENIKKYDKKLFVEKLTNGKKGGIGLLTLKENHKVEFGFLLSDVDNKGKVRIQAKINVKELLSCQ